MRVSIGSRVIYSADRFLDEVKDALKRKRLSADKLKFDKNGNFVSFNLEGQPFRILKLKDDKGPYFRLSIGPGIPVGRATKVIDLMPFLMKEFQ